MQFHLINFSFIIFPLPSLNGGMHHGSLLDCHFFSIFHPLVNASFLMILNTIYLLMTTKFIYLIIPPTLSNAKLINLTATSISLHGFNTHFKINTLVIDYLIFPLKSAHHSFHCISRR